MMRNQGEEFHRNNASALTEQLYLAACRAVTSKCLADLKITSIVNATIELPTVAYQKQDTIQIAVEDKVGAKLNIYFDLIADKINQVHLTGGKILIYCRAGQSRSATLCIAYFMKYHDMTFDQAYQFVRTRRPIIHPNRGFVHQLKQYEEKLQAKPVFSAPSVSRDNSFKLASRLSFAVDDALEETVFVDADSSWDKPVKPFRPGRSRVHVTLHEPLATVADRHEVVVINECGEALEPAASKMANTENSNVGMAELRGVASASLNPATMGALPATEPLNARAKRRAAFTKLTKPNDIAVSVLNIPLHLIIPSDSKVFKIQTKPEHCSSAIPDVLQAYAVSEEILPECLGSVTISEKADARAKTVICRGRECAVQVETCPLIWLAAAELSNKLQQKQEPAAGPRPNPPSLSTAATGNKATRTFIPATNVSKYSAARNNSSVTQPPKLMQRQGSVKGIFRPSVNQVVPAVATKRTQIPAAPAPEVVVERMKALVKRCTDYKTCATHLQPPLILEAATIDRAAGKGEDATWRKKTEKSAKVVTTCNSIAVLAQVAWQAVQPAPTLDIPIDSYHRLDFSFASFEVSQIASKSTAVFLGAESSEFGQNMTVIREFPYYSTVLLTSALDMSRAQEETKLNVKWFKVEKPKVQRPDPVELIMKISEQKQEEHRRKVSQPQVKWGTERCLTDDFQTALEMITKVPTPCKALRYKVMPMRDHLTDSLPFIWLKTELLGKFYVPHYNPVLITRTVGPTIRPVVISTRVTVMEMANIYTVPRTSHSTVSDKAKKAVHLDCLALTTVNMPLIKTDFEIEEIPDEIHDIQDIKRVLSEDGESHKCKIWFDVFKRTLMRKRPTFPKVSRSEFLPTASVSNCILLEFPNENLPDSNAIPLRALPVRHRPLIAVASVREVKEIEKYTEFSRFVKPTLVPEKFTSGLVLSDEYVTTCTSGWAWESVEHFKPKTTDVKPTLEKAVSTVSFPNRLYTVSEVKVEGLTGDYSPSTHHKQARTAFTKLTRPRKAAVCHLPLRLCVATDLPEYQFVQDIEEQADEEYHRSLVTCRATHTSTDSFWFFAMETAKPRESQHSHKLGPPQGASKYQLFLPDSEMASKIGRENMFPEDAVDAHSTEESLAVVNPGALVAEAMLEIKDSKPAAAKLASQEVRLSRRGSQRVSFRPAAAGEDEDEMKKRTKTIYYGRDRSKSRTRLKDVPKVNSKDVPKDQQAAKQQRGATAVANNARQRRDKSTNRYNEAEVMKNLESSVNEANDILTRHRGNHDFDSPGPIREAPMSPLLSPYPDYRSPRLQTRSEERHARRSRDSELNRKETERYERNKRMMEEAKMMAKKEQMQTMGSSNRNTRVQEAGPRGPGARPPPRPPAEEQKQSVAPEASDVSQGGQNASFGLLSFAQNFLGGRRREQSKDRSRDLARRASRKFM